MSQDRTRSRVATNPPVCPSCESPSRVVLEQEPADADDPQVWRCDHCGVRWQVTLTPRFER